jgi:hypothetical protein
VLLQLKPHDERHSMQECAVQCGMRLGVTAQLASRLHTRQRRHSSAQPTAATRQQHPQAG